METTRKLARPLKVLFLKVFLQVQNPNTRAVPISMGEVGYPRDFIVPIHAVFYLRPRAYARLLPGWSCPNLQCSAGFQPALSRQDGGATFKLGHSRQVWGLLRIRQRQSIVLAE